MIASTLWPAFLNFVDQAQRSNSLDAPPVILSLGAGVQSSTMALMAAAGEITPMPVAAIFADTQAEPKNVYSWLDWLEKQLPFPVIRVTAGDLGDDSTQLRVSKKSGNSYLRHTVPAYTLNGKTRGMLMRQCTRDYKINVVLRASRKILKDLNAKNCEQWIGISTDEASRMKPSRHAMFVNRWPLIENDISRQQCLEWMTKHGFPTPPRSACSFCPYHSDAEWLRLKKEEPEAFTQAIDYEQKLLNAVKASTALKIDSAFLHKSRVPLDQVVFDISSANPTDDFQNECEGMCGV